MSGDEVAAAIGGVMMLVLVGSSLAARRLPGGSLARMVLAWVAIFAIVLLGYSLWNGSGTG